MSPSPRIMGKPSPSSPNTTRFLPSMLNRKLSSIVEGSFLDVEETTSPHVTNVKLGQRAALIQTPPSETLSKETNHRVIISFGVVYTMIFFNGCCFTAVVPSVPFYLKELGATPSFLGLVVSFYSFGQIIGSPISGHLNDRTSANTLLTFSSSLGLAAAACYALAPNYYFVLISRLMTGVSAGVEFTTELAFIARNTTAEERTVFLASVTAANVLGFILGPALSTIIAMVDVDILGFKINGYTGPGWLLVVMFALDIIMVRCLFEDSSLAAALIGSDGEKRTSTSYGAISEDEEVELMESTVELPPSVDEVPPPKLRLVLSLIFTQFTAMCSWSVLETITSPLAFDSFGWSVHECNILFTCGGAAGLLAYVIFVIASKFIADRCLIVAALVTCSLGFTSMVHWNFSFLPTYRNMFLAGYLLVNAGFMCGRPVIFALYSKLTPEKYQGRYLGYMVAGGSAARTLGPFVAVYLYYHVEAPFKNTLALFGSGAAILIICLVMIISLWPSLLYDKRTATRVDGSTNESKSLLDKSSRSANGDVSMHVDKVNKMTQ